MLVYTGRTRGCLALAWPAHPSAMQMDPSAWLMEKIGIRPRDVPGAIITFNSLLWLEWMAVFGCCLRGRPLRTLAATPTGVRWRKTLSKNRTYSRIEASCLRSAAAMSSSRFFGSVQRRFRVDPTHLTYSLAETVVVYNSLFVVWLPINCTVAKAYCDWAATDTHKSITIGEADENDAKNTQMLKVGA